MSEMASFRRDDRPEVPCLGVEGEIDLENVDEFAEGVAKLISDARWQTVLDLTGVTFFGSTAIGALVMAEGLAQERGIHLVVVPSAIVRRVLEVTGMTGAFELRDDAA